MDIHDIKIGDKITINGNIVTVSEILKNNVVFMELSGGYDIAECTPIEITNDILKALGFNSEIYGYSLHISDKHINIDDTRTLWITGGDKILERKNISYIHQFQHELYDSNVEFKIEL
jgi:hypothetical protein